MEDIEMDTLVLMAAESDGTPMDDLPEFSRNSNILNSGVKDFLLVDRSATPSRTLATHIPRLVSEYILVRVEDAISPELLCTISGLFPAVFYAIWQLLYTLPNYQVVVVDSIEAAHGSEAVVIICYVLLAVAAFIHSTLFYYLIHKLGSPLTSSSKIIQSLIIFVSSHFAFCPTRKSQCLTTSKTISFALVLGGIVLYSYRISWRPGGSRLLAFSAERRVGSGDCVKYVKMVDAHNNVKIVAQKELQCLISGLASGVPYEFRISALNDMGEGVPSEPSDPI
eukprot:gene18588-18873_t